MNAGRPAARNGSALRRWHRRVGIAACVFLAWLAISGVLLNHGTALGIDRIHLQAAWLMRLYGLKADVARLGYEADGHWLAVVDDTGVLDGRRLDPTVRRPLGLVAAGGMIGIATPDRLALFLPDGERADEVRAGDLPTPQIVRAGRAGGRFIVEGPSGAWSSADAVTWTVTGMEGVEWSVPRELPADRHDELSRAGMPEVTLEQALLDAHSGRLFGRLGPLVADFAAISALALAMSGAWMFWRRSRRV